MGTFKKVMSITPQQEQLFIEYYKEGLGTAFIAMKFRVSQSFLEKKLRENNVQLRSYPEALALMYKNNILRRSFLERVK